MFTPITTERLVIRSMVADDAKGLAERRSHPDVAEFQTWATPFSLVDAQALVESVMAMAGPENDEWWMASVCDRRSGAVVGDVGVSLSWEGRTAEVGYNFDPDHWGKGFAVEALDALVDYLFDDAGVTRVFGMLHPDNVASAQLLERTGFRFEGHTRSSFWKEDDLSDDWIYGMTRPDRDRWRAPPRILTPCTRWQPIGPRNDLSHRWPNHLPRRCCPQNATDDGSVHGCGRWLRTRWLRAS